MHTVSVKEMEDFEVIKESGEQSCSKGMKHLDMCVQVKLRMAVAPSQIQCTMMITKLQRSWGQPKAICCHVGALGTLLS